MQMARAAVAHTKERPSRKETQAKQSAKTNKDHLHLVAQLKPLNESQRQLIFAYKEGMNVIASGSAGTGKSYVLCALALEKLLAKKIAKIVIVRSAVTTRDQGFLPGSLDEKAEPYKAPYKQIINQLCGNGTAWDVLVKKGMIEFITTSYVRGITLENCDVIIDEFQNMNISECYSVITRVGENCQLALCGDTKQTDLNKRKEESCFDWIMGVALRLPKWFDMVHFTNKDIVRSDFCRDFIIAVEELQ